MQERMQRRGNCEKSHSAPTSHKCMRVQRESDLKGVGSVEFGCNSSTAMCIGSFERAQRADHNATSNAWANLSQRTQRSDSPQRSDSK